MVVLGLSCEQPSVFGSGLVLVEVEVKPIFWREKNQAPSGKGLTVSKVASGYHFPIGN